MDGLLLSLITIVTTAVNMLAGVTFVSFICWAAKTGFSIWALYFFMKRFASLGRGESVFGYGVMVCLFSSIVCAVFSYAAYRWLFPDTIVEALDAARGILQQQNSPDEAFDALNMIEDNAPQLACASALIWGSLIGIIFSAILCRPASSFNEISADDGEEEL